MSHPTSNVSPLVELLSADVINACTSDEELETELKKKLDSVFAENGTPYIQKRLQDEIAKVKIKESEVALVRKQNTVAARQLDEVKESISRLSLQHAKIENHCSQLREVMKRRAIYVEESLREITGKVNSAKEKVEQDILLFGEKASEHEAAANLLREENDKLKEDFDQRNEGMRTASSKTESELLESARNSPHRVQYSEKQEEVFEIENQLLLLRRENEGMIGTMKQQIQILEKYQSMEATLRESQINPEDVQRIAEQNAKALDSTISNLEKDIAGATEARLRIEKEITDLRSKVACSKKELHSCERAKFAAEKRCRGAQKMMK